MHIPQCQRVNPGLNAGFYLSLIGWIAHGQALTVCLEILQILNRIIALRGLSAKGIDVFHGSIFTWLARFCGGVL